MNTTALFTTQLRRRYLPSVSDASIARLASMASYHGGHDADTFLAVAAALALIGEHTSQFPELWPDESSAAFAEASVAYLVEPGPGSIGMRFHAVCLALNVPGLDALGPQA